MLLVPSMKWDCWWLTRYTSSVLLENSMTMLVNYIQYQLQPAQTSLDQ